MERVKGRERGREREKRSSGLGVGVGGSRSDTTEWSGKMGIGREGWGEEGGSWDFWS